MDGTECLDSGYYTAQSTELAKELDGYGGQEKGAFFFFFFFWQYGGL
jgi:hypothetical protein